MNKQLLWKMLEGKVINNQYYLKKLLGAGGFGGVFLADDVIDDTLIRQIAIKILTSDSQDKQQQLKDKQQQLKEISTTTNLRHTNLIHCFHGGKCNLGGSDFLYLVMEVANSSLEKQLTQGVLSETETTLLVQDIAEALVYLHNQPKAIVHRDLKPGNVLRVGDKWKLSDLGLVKIIGAGSVSNTSKLFGTAQYVPPESYDGKISPAWDVWSLGIIIAEALTGKPPFQGETPQQLQKQICEKEPDLSGLPQKFEPIVRGCLEKNRKNRWTARRVLTELLGQNLKPNPINLEHKIEQDVKPNCRLENFSVIRTIEHSEWVMSLAISPDGCTFASGNYDKTIKIWELSTGREIRTLGSFNRLLRFIFKGHSNSISSLAISPNNRTLVSASWDTTIKMWQLSTGEEISTLTGHSKEVTCLAISHDGQTIVSASYDQTIKIWQMSTGQEIRTLTGHSEAVLSLAISPDGQTLVSGSKDETIKIWQMSTGQEIRTLTGHILGTYSLAISPDGQTLVSGSERIIKVWQLNTGQEVYSLKSGGGHQVWALAISPDGKTLVSGDFNKIKIWQLSTGVELGILTGHLGEIYSLAISPDGQTLISASNDKMIKVWREV